MKALDRLLALLALALGLGMTAFAITEANSGRDPRGLLAVLTGGVLAVLLAASLVGGYRLALQTQRDRLSESSAGFVVSAALDGETREGIDHLRPNLGFNIHSVAVLIADDGLQLWTGIGRPFELLSIPFDVIKGWTATDSRLLFEIADPRGEQITLSVSPRFVGRWAVRVPNPERMNALRSGLLRTPLGRVPSSAPSDEPFRRPPMDL